MKAKTMNLRVRECLVLTAAISALALSACGKNTGSVAGSTDSTIIGGTDATGSEDFAPVVVSVYNAAKGGLCTGSIVSDSLIVTAAHCVDGKPSDLRLIFGTDIRNEQTRTVKMVDAYKVSPLWPFRSDEEFNAGDIAMIKFSGGLPAGYRAAQILNDKSALQNGTVVTLAGYGISDGVAHTGAGNLRYTDVKIQNAAYSESEVLVSQTEGKGACHGDSGGPAYVRVNGQLMLWGVTNRGVNDPKNDCSVSAAYANILAHTDWLKETATELLKAPTAPAAARLPRTQAAN
jgi:secreted trypsin-like serine protease